MSLTTRSGLGFDLHSIELYRFMNYKIPTKFRFNSPYIVISGPTGSGKSTILDALTFALFSRSSRLDLTTVKMEDVCDKGGKVICRFKTGTDKIRVERGRDRKGKSYLELRINNKRIPGKIPELNEKIRSTILGMNYQAFVSSTIIRQDEMKALGSKTSNERLKTLQNLFRLDIFEKAISEAQKELLIISSNRNKKEGEIQAKKDELLRIEGLKVDLNELKPKINLLKKNQKLLSDDISKLVKKEDEYQIKLRSFQSLREKEVDSIKRLEVLEKELISAEEELKEYNLVKKQLLELETKIKSIQDIEDRINLLERYESEYKLIEENIKILDEKKQKREEGLIIDLNSKFERLKTERTRMNNLDTTIDHETAFKILNQEGRLLERIQRISLEQSWNLPEKMIDELRQEQIQARKDLTSISTKRGKITRDSFLLTEIQNNIFELEKEVNELDKRLKEAKASDEREINSLKKKLEKIDFSMEKQKELSELKTTQSENERIRKEYDITKHHYEKRIDPTSKISTFKKQKNEIENLMKTLKKELEGFQEFKTKYENLVTELDTKKKENDSLIIEIARTDERIKSTVQKIEEIEKLRPEIEKIDRDIKDLIKQEEILEILKNDVFHTTGAPFYAIGKILPRLGKRASLILSELSNQRFANIQLKRVDTGRKTIGFEILLHVPDGIRDIATFSGGEKTQINAALRLAISEEISDLSIANRKGTEYKKTLFIDEGDLGSLDTVVAQQAFVKKLFKLTNRFKIVLITHLTEVANQFPNSINITRDRYGRSIKA